MMKIVDFIDARLPGFRDAVRGASPEAIAALQSRTRAPLPRVYLDFLSVMGEDSSAFPAFPGYVWSAAALLDCWPGDDAIAYDKDRYFKIALNASEEAVSYEDYFLDLARSDGDDAPIVAFEDSSEDGVPGDPHATIVGEWADTRFMLGDWLCSQAFHFFELMRRPELASCGVYTDLDAPHETWQEVCEVLRRQGLQEPMPGRRAWFGVGAQVSIHALLLNVVTLRVGAASRTELLRTIETLRDNLDIVSVGEVPRQESPTSL